MDWFTETVVKANPQDLSVAMYDSLGTLMKPTWSFRNAYPIKWTELGSERERHRVPHRDPRDRPLRLGAQVMPAPKKHIPSGFVPAYLKIDPATTIPCYFNPTEYSIAEDQRRGSPKEVTGHVCAQARVRGRPAAQDGAQPAVRPDCSRRTRMSVREATAHPARRDGRPGELDRAARPPLSAPFITFRLGPDRLQGRVHVADLHVQALPARRRAGPRRRQADASLRPSRRPRARTRRPARPPAIGMHTVRDGDTLPSISYACVRRRDAVAADRRGQRRRQPAAPAPRRVALACRPLES